MRLSSADAMLEYKDVVSYGLGIELFVMGDSTGLKVELIESMLCGISVCIILLFTFFLLHFFTLAFLRTLPPPVLAPSISGLAGFK